MINDVQPVSLHVWGLVLGTLQAFRSQHGSWRWVPGDISLLDDCSQYSCGYSALGGLKLGEGSMQFGCCFLKCSQC